MIEAQWQVTVSRARELSEATLNDRVDEEWSFVETLRHLVLTTHCWLRRMVKGIDRPYHPWGLAGSWLVIPRPGGSKPARTRLWRKFSTSVVRGWTRSSTRSPP